MKRKGPEMQRTKLAVAIALALAGIANAPNASAKSRTNAIIGTGADAIIGTGGPKANAIIGTGADAIIGTGGPKANAIIGTGRTKVASANAIIGTGGPKANAIIGTGADAIIGTGGPKANAIIGTGRTKVASANAIIGTGGPKANAIIGTGADAIIGTGRAESLKMGTIIGSGKSRLLHLAPVDSVDARSNSIRTLGKIFRVPDAKAIADRLAAGENLLAAVDGTLGADGTITKSTLRLVPNSYVAGASKLLLVGRVTSVDTSVGSLKLGAATVDIAAAEVARAPKPGELVAIVGTQPIRGGVMLAERIGLR